MEMFEMLELLLEEEDLLQNPRRGCQIEPRPADYHQIHPYFKFPENENFKKKWCAKIGRKDFKPTSLSRICSLHFTDNCFRGTSLKSDAVPTNFFHDWHSALVEFQSKQKKDMKTDKEILSDINKDILKLKKPSCFKHPLGTEKNNAVCKEDSSEHVKLWGIINKQVLLINKLMFSEQRPEGATLKELADAKAENKELERKLETFKYIVKCLQERQTTLEEQVEILSAVESR